jgi:hypothetical protein
MGDGRCGLSGPGDWAARLTNRNSCVGGFWHFDMFDVLGLLMCVAQRVEVVCGRRWLEAVWRGRGHLLLLPKLAVTLEMLL